LSSQKPRTNFDWPALCQNGLALSVNLHFDYVWPKLHTKLASHVASNARSYYDAFTLLSDTRKGQPCQEHFSMFRLLETDPKSVKRPFPGFAEYATVFLAT